MIFNSTVKSYRVTKKYREYLTRGSLKPVWERDNIIRPAKKPCHGTRLKINTVKNWHCWNATVKAKPQQHIMDLQAKTIPLRNNISKTSKNLKKYLTLDKKLKVPCLEGVKCFCDVCVKRINTFGLPSYV